MNLLRLPELEAVERAEDFFEQLEVPYDRAVLAVHRTRLLRLFGRAVAALHASVPFLGEAALRATLRGALRDAYESLAEGAAPSLPVGATGRLVQLRRKDPP